MKNSIACIWQNKMLFFDFDINGKQSFRYTILRLQMVLNRLIINMFKTFKNES